MQIHDQKPASLEAIYIDALSNDGDPVLHLTEGIVDPLYVPLGSKPVSIIDDDGSLIDQDDMKNLVLSASGDIHQSSLDKKLKEVYSLGFSWLSGEYKGASLTADEVFIAQAAKKKKLPLCQKGVYYTTQDLIDSSKEFLAGNEDADWLTANFGQYARCATLGIWFRDATAFDGFKTGLKNLLPAYRTNMSPADMKLMQDMDSLDLSDLTCGITIREKDEDGQSPWSFARTITSALFDYVRQSPDMAGLIPFSVAELYNPKTLLFVNLERHAHSAASTIESEWQIVKQSLDMPPRILGNSQITKLDSTVRSMQKVSQKAQAASRGLDALKSQTRPLSSHEPTTLDIVKIVQKTIKKMSNVAMSHNWHKDVKFTYMKANRRHPEDFNLAGKMTSTVYKPDIHLYIDTSGSISEQNYEETVKACIKLAKKLDVDLYFNSFSHVMSRSTLLHTRSKSTKQIYNQFARIPKVNGGTDYSQIWQYIQASPKRRKELGLVITDFEYLPPRHAMKHPENLYYLPCSKMDWDHILKEAKRWMENMDHIEPDIRKHVLF